MGYGGVSKRRFRRYLPRAWCGCLYWADAESVYGVNRDIRGKKTEVMLLVPLGSSGLCIIRQKGLEGE